MAESPREITFIVSGSAQSTEEDTGTVPAGATVRSAARMGARRGTAETIRLKAKVGEDVVRLHIANGPTLYLHPENARELLRAQAGVDSGATRGGSSDEGVLVVPSQLAWRGLQSAQHPGSTRGSTAEGRGDVVVNGVDILTGVVKDKAAKLAGAAIVRKVDGQVDPGVYLLNADSLPPLKESGQKPAVTIAESDQPFLALVHGTFSNTAGTFGKLWTTHPALVRALFKNYGGRVYGLEHATLGDNPFGNALLLARAMPKGATLHLLTHSRGGLVAEALARVSGGAGTSKDDLALFDDAAFAQYRRDLEELAQVVRAKQIKVERVVRVACPARGTLLASRRLDAFLSVFKWGLQSAGIPVLPQIVDFIGEVARRRAKPEELPGLEVMMPGSAFTKWVNRAGQTIDGDLRVIAGDVQGDSLLSWLKTLVTDAFYWTDHDLVVQTRSMYGGSPRANGRAVFMLDRGSKVNHFNYFSNERTADLIVRGLTEQSPEYFRAIGPLSWAGEDASGVRGAIVERSRGARPADRPAVFVLPGILGSHLKVDGKRVWLSLRFVNNLDRLKWDPKTADSVVADGPMGSSYDDLIKHLADTHEVIPFGYDWRRPLQHEAKRLADAMEKALSAREVSKQPVRIVAHSMGGLLARTMELERPETWKRFIGRPGSRFLMLGTPNGGSFAPMQVMSGDDTFGNLFAMFGSLFDGVEARNIVAGMPGLLQLQAELTGGKRDLGSVEAWEKLARDDLEEIDRRISLGSFWHKEDEQREILKWGIPSAANLKIAVELRRKLDQQKDRFGSFAANTALVLGKAKATPAGVDAGDDGVFYLDTTQGDGRVTHKSAMLPGVKTWQVDTGHGDLADARKAFEAYVDILTTGETSKLPVVVEGFATRGGSAPALAETLTRSRPSRVLRSDAPPSQLNDVFQAQPESAPPEKAGSRVRISITNGNLKFVRAPLLIGHYHSSKLTGAEAVIDRLIGQSMSRSLKARLYPTAIGASQVFLNNQANDENPYAKPRPEAVIVVGLGEEGMLRLSQLTESVRQGVIAYAQRVAEKRENSTATFELASTLIGSGGINQSAGASAQAITLGVLQANEALAEIGWPVVEKLQLIELHLDRAAEAIVALRALDDSHASGVILEPFIEQGRGALVRPPETGYRSTEYDVISVSQKKSATSSELEYVLSTRRARDEVRGSMAQSKLVDSLVKTGADDRNDDVRIGRTLFKLLVPIEIEAFLAGSTALQLLLDQETAAYPWEMLDLHREDGDRDAMPWGIQTRMLRKLRTATFRETPRGSITGGVLVIGEPQCSDRYPPLPGARNEAEEVAKVLDTEALLNGNEKAISTAVFERQFSILHVAGHGDEIDGVKGIVLSNDITFGAREIAQMRIVPELAFINCCHVGSFSDPSRAAPKLRDGRPGFAANVAQGLIQIGVRCVVVAGWAVDDQAALLFARTFYRHLKNGRRFIDAVGEARAITYRQFPHVNTWAAYQCYGDADWTYGPARDAGNYSPTFSRVASRLGLVIRLDALALDHRYSGKSADAVLMELRFLEENSDAKWLKLGDVAAGFGRVYGEVLRFDEAVKWYTVAKNAEDGSAGLRALEQLGNMLSRHGENLARENPRDEAVRAEALQKIEQGIGYLRQLEAISSTAERDALLGSAYKRLAKVERTVAGKRAALARAHGYYLNAERRARAGNGELHYAALNAMSIELRLRSLGDKKLGRFEATRIKEVRESLSKRNQGDANFWSVIGDLELDVYEAVDAGHLARVAGSTMATLLDVWNRASSLRQWDSFEFQMRATLDDYCASAGASAAEKAACRAFLSQIPAAKREASQESADAGDAASVPVRPKKKPRRKK